MVIYDKNNLSVLSVLGTESSWSQFSVFRPLNISVAHVKQLIFTPVYVVLLMWKIWVVTKLLRYLLFHFTYFVVLKSLFAAMIPDSYATRLKLTTKTINIDIVCQNVMTTNLKHPLVELCTILYIHSVLLVIYIEKFWWYKKVKYLCYFMFSFVFHRWVILRESDIYSFL